MILNCFLKGFFISLVSIIIYIIFTDNKNETDRKNEYLIIISIIFLSSSFVIYTGSGDSNSLVVKEQILDPTMNNKPPF